MDPPENQGPPPPAYSAAGPIRSQNQLASLPLLASASPENELRPTAFFSALPVRPAPQTRRQPTETLLPFQRYSIFRPAQLDPFGSDAVHGTERVVDFLSRFSNLVAGAPHPVPVPSVPVPVASAPFPVPPVPVPSAPFPATSVPFPVSAVTPWRVPMSTFEFTAPVRLADDSSRGMSEERSPSLGPAFNNGGAQQPLPAQAQQDAPQHKRVYQACIPCRRRKVKCDLGPVDNPHEPPCVRCRRESKECFFSATRRKRKADDGSLEDEEYIVRNSRRKLDAGDDVAARFNSQPLTPAGVNIRSIPLPRPGKVAPQAGSDGNAAAKSDDVLAGDEPNTPLENLEARSVMRPEVYGPHDALDLLYKAATNRKSSDAGDGSTGPSQGFAPLHGAASSEHGSRRHDKAGASQSASHSGQGRPPVAQASGAGLDSSDLASEPGYADAIRLWTRFRFVRAGWFTAQEAIDYIAYYYKYLSPLTPISPPTFNNPASHVTLLNEEPILAVTLLTIASRYKTLSGAGATCRSYAIHEQLWTYLRGMIERVIWGQEAFGGGFCGSGADESQTSSTAPWRGLRKGSLRTLGTIESLLILTEWHPRALHFPPADVTDELLLPETGPGLNSVLGPLDGAVTGAEAGDQRPKGVGGKRIDSWLEPAWRSDRMCWMLLSAAMGLGYELGIFDDIDEFVAEGAIPRPEYEDETYRHRAFRIKRLLLIYVTQLAGRLGWTSMMPESLRKKDPATRRRPLSEGGQTPGTTLSSASNAFNYIPDLELDDQIIHCWVGISNAMHTGNERLFRSRTHTTEIIQTGRYIELLKDFQPMLRDWWNEFQRFKLPTYTRYILEIEYQYVRIYVNSLSLQAVVERCTSNAGNAGNTVAAGGNGGASATQLSPQTQHYYGKLPIGQLGGFGVADQEYVKEVVEGCRSLLRTVVEGLLPDGYLKHVPVRTYFRIISGAMFLLKTFALGAPRADVEVSISLMDRTVNALRNCVVDDVHLGSRFADLLESLTSRLRNRFIHAPPPSMPPSTDGRSPMHGDAAAAAVAAATAGNGQALASVNGSGTMNGNANLAATNGDIWPKANPSGLVDQSGAPANISATPFDPATGNFPFASASTMFNPSAVSAAGMESFGDSMLADGIDWTASDFWYLPPGSGLFKHMPESGVAMTAEGVNVGGVDLLDYMTMDAPNSFPSDADGNGF